MTKDTKIIHQWCLAKRPAGFPVLSDFELSESSLPSMVDSQILIKNHYISVDPYVRGRMKPLKSYVDPLNIGDVVDGAVAGEVIESKHPDFAPGDWVAGRGGWQTVSILRGDEAFKIPKNHSHPSWFVGALGMTGLTAYFALLSIGQPNKGETVLISGAAGAVGSIAGQIAKIKGCRVVGITGSEEKVAFLKDIGFDAVINYKTEKNIRRAIKESCPHRVDIYFDNVGGSISDAAIMNINMKGRIIICGQISYANSTQIELGPRLYLYLLVYRARMEGFLIHDHKESFPSALKELEDWIKSGQIKVQETIVDGFEKTPEAFIGLFKGTNIGKMVVKI